MMRLSETMRRLIEKNAGFTVPLEAGDPASSLSVGTVIEISDDKRPTVAHLEEEPFNIQLGDKSATGILDIDLGLSRLVTAKAGVDSTIAPNEEVRVSMKLSYKRDVVLSLDPAKGERLNSLLLIAASLVNHPQWNHRKHAFVFRTFAVNVAKMHIAKKGNGEITLSGKQKAVSRTISGQLDTSVTWEFENIISEEIKKSGILGIHCARVLANGSLKFV
jgi:hypothetical protein